VTTSDQALAETLRQLRDHGSPSKYRHTLVGTNARLDSIQAAALSIKLQHLNDWNAARYRHAEAYAVGLKDSGVIAPALPASGEHNFHVFVVRTERRDELREHLAERGIETGIHYPVPLHLTEAYQRLGAPPKGSLSVSESLAGEILSLPMFPELTSEQIEYTVESIHNFCERNSMPSNSVSCA